MKKLPINIDDEPISCGVGKAAVTMLPAMKPINKELQIIDNDEGEILVEIKKIPEKNKKPAF
jgi:hypothetical protein